MIVIRRIFVVCVWAGVLLTLGDVVSKGLRLIWG